MSLASGDSLAYAYTGSNAYAYSGGNAYAYTGPNAYAYAYGFGGYPGNPMLATGLASARAAIAAAVPFDFELKLHPSGRVTPAKPQDLGRLGAQVRLSMAMLELMSGVAFRIQSASGCLYATADGAPASKLLAMISAPRDAAYFRKQLVLVDSWGPRRETRLPEILTQVAPPIAYFASLLNIQGDRHPRTLEFVNVALQFAYAVCMSFKHALAVTRPSSMSPQVQAVVEVPMHPSLPSGHATEAHLTAALLGRLAGADPGSSGDEMLRRLAHRIAENRVVAGLHFPIDNVAGRLLGDALAGYVLALVGVAPKWSTGVFDGAGLKAEDAKDGVVAEDRTTIVGRFTGPGCVKDQDDKGREYAIGDAVPPVLQQMWADAEAEWQ